jgi:hypothetical protein
MWRWSVGNAIPLGGSEEREIAGEKVGCMMRSERDRSRRVGRVREAQQQRVVRERRRKHV